MVIPSEQIIPIWIDRRHKTLERLIRLYDVIVYEGTKKKTVTKIELWYPDRVESVSYTHLDVYKRQILISLMLVGGMWLTF